MTAGYLPITGSKENILFTGWSLILWATFEEAIPGSFSFSPFLLASSKVTGPKSTHLGLFNTTFGISASYR